jgi:murein DD-endopeptidase MepM/ murein hydrolase activator NlpD
MYMVPGKSRVVTAALATVLTSTMTFGVAASAGAATSDVAEAVETAKQATRTLEKAKKSANKSASELESATAATKKANQRIAAAERLVITTDANLERARAAAAEISAQVDAASVQTQELEPEDGLIDVAAKAADVAGGTSDLPVLDAATGAAKAGLTGVIGPVLSLLDSIGNAVQDEVAQADLRFAEAESHEQQLRQQKVQATAAHRAASMEWTEATAEFASAKAALNKAIKAEKKAAKQESKAAKAVKKAKETAAEAKAAEETARAKAAEQQKKQAAQRAAAGRSEAAGTASRSAVVSGRVRPGTGSITSRYGMRTHPVTGAYKLHSGTDYSYGDGNAYAAAAGTVTSVAYDGAYGNIVTISHGGVETRYAHLSGARVSSGQQVSAGQVVGKIGSTGYATGPHLHFEVLIGGDFVNPEGWLGG